MNLRRWFREHSLKVLAIRDTPEAIAGGVAIGIFFGFTPLIGIKTLSAIFISWVTRCNILAAVLAATLHDVMIPVMPAIYWWEYAVGYWLLSNPHEWPPRISKLWQTHPWRDWHRLFTVGQPLLLGSVVCATPISLIIYVLTKIIIARHQARKKAEPDSGGEPVE